MVSSNPGGGELGIGVLARSCWRVKLIKLHPNSPRGLLGFSSRRAQASGCALFISFGKCRSEDFSLLFLVCSASLVTSS